ncbi:protein NETWORKED 4A-like isoform X1 [Primulina tabacum]|uniref:protein NETWORKED 4A-like isoform X1 n=2 Tax=Primulina tabacum TaxID=48773 RepID=UPI003F5A4848
MIGDLDKLLWYQNFCSPSIQHLLSVLLFITLILYVFLFHFSDLYLLIALIVYVQKLSSTSHRDETKARPNRMKRLKSKKSHSWWWDSHISPTNSKWLQENLEEIDEIVKRMLKIIEGDADSFAKKAELYYKRRPELVNLVEEFYRRHRSLAERYDVVAGELRKSIPSDLVSQCSGVSDVGSEQSIHSSDRKKSHGNSRSRTAGFDVFLGSGGSGSELNNKGDGSSSSESETDDSSIDNYDITPSNDGETQELRQKNIELENQLGEVKEKLKMLQEEISEEHKKSHDGNAEFSSKIAVYEEELRVAKEKIQHSGEEITHLTIELQKYHQSLEDSNNSVTDPKVLDSNSLEELSPALELGKNSNRSQAEDSDSVHNIQMLEEELRIAQEKLHDSVEEIEKFRQELMSKGSLIQNLQNQLESAQTEASDTKNKLEKERRKILELQNEIIRYKTCLSDSDRVIRELKETLSNAKMSLSEENEQLQTQISRMTTGKTHLEDNLKELDLRRQSLEDELRLAKAGKDENGGEFRVQIDQLNADITERNDRLEELNKTFDSLKLKHESQMSKKDDQIDQMSKHLHQLHIEHVKLIAGAERAHKLSEELGSRVKELEREVERKQETILEGAEEKREAIRQLCFSLEHYRDGYHKLRQVILGHKRLPVMAS